MPDQEMKVEAIGVIATEIEVIMTATGKESENEGIDTGMKEMKDPASVKGRGKDLKGMTGEIGIASVMDTERGRDMIENEIHGIAIQGREITVMTGDAVGMSKKSLLLNLCPHIVIADRDMRRSLLQLQ